MNHSFDTDLAKEFGVSEAILIQHLQFWIIKNACNNKKYFDSKYWTYNTHKAYQKIFYYFSESQIKRTINRLIDKKVIIKGNYNTRNGDRTNWYTFADNRDDDKYKDFYNEFVINELAKRGVTPKTKPPEEVKKECKNKISLDEIVQASDEYVSVSSDEIVRALPVLEYKPVSSSDNMSRDYIKTRLEKLKFESKQIDNLILKAFLSDKNLEHFQEILKITEYFYNHNLGVFKDNNYFSFVYAARDNNKLFEKYKLLYEKQTDPPANSCLFSQEALVTSRMVKKNEYEKYILNLSEVIFRSFLSKQDRADMETCAEKEACKKIKHGQGELYSIKLNAYKFGILRNMKLKLVKNFTYKIWEKGARENNLAEMEKLFFKHWSEKKNAA